MMKRMTVLAVFAGIAVIGGAAWASDGWWSNWFGAKAPAKPVAAAPAVPAATAIANLGNALDIQPTDRVMGSMTAPVTIIEYASMTCSHCADFNNTTMVQVKKEWVATGKAKFVLRDLAWDNLAVGMAKVARCAPASQYFKLADGFFANQMNIITSNEPLAQIKAVAANFGLDGAKVEACVKDEALHAEVEESKRIALEVLGIRGTPTLYVNGTKVDGAADYAEMKKVLEEQFTKATRVK